MSNVGTSVLPKAGPEIGLVSMGQLPQVMRLLRDQGKVNRTEMREGEAEKTIRGVGCMGIASAFSLPAGCGLPVWEGCVWGLEQG